MFIHSDNLLNKIIPVLFHAHTEFSPERCAAPNLNADTVLQTFDRTCYEFHVTRGESFDKAQQICKSHGKYLFNYLFVRNPCEKCHFSQTNEKKTTEVTFCQPSQADCMLELLFKRLKHNNSKYHFMYDNS